MNINSTLDDFQDALDKEHLDLAEFVLDRDELLIEMFETGSAEFEVNDRKFIVALVIQEVKDELK